MKPKSHQIPSAMNTECEVMRIGFYGPDPTNRCKNPNIVLQNMGSKVRVVELGSGQVFDLNREDWISIDQMKQRLHTSVEAPSPNYDHEQQVRVLNDGIDVLIEAAKIANPLDYIHARADMKDAWEFLPLRHSIGINA